VKILIIFTLLMCSISYADDLVPSRWLLEVDDDTNDVLVPVETTEINGGIVASGNLSLDSTTHVTKGNINLGESLYIAPDGSAPGNTSYGVIVWPNGSRLYEQSGGGDPERFFYLAGGDRWEVLNEAGTNFIMSVNGNNSDIPNRVSIVPGVTIGGVYFGVAPPTSGIIVAGDTGLGRSDPIYRLDVKDTANIVMRVEGNTNFATILFQDSADVVRGYIGYSDSGAYISGSIEDGLHIRGTTGITLGHGTNAMATFDLGETKFFGNVTMGEGTAATDYTLTFDGETNDGLITYMEDEDVLLFNDGLAGTPDEITATDAGVAASIKTISTEVTTNGDADLDNVTLANGISGQIKHIYCVVEGNAADTWKITPAIMCGGTQITFAGVGEGCTLIYANNEGWVVVSSNGGVIT
jgi:hypothetical protein